MHVPYSMDDNEPDLYGIYGVHEVDDHPVTPREAQRLYTQADIDKLIAQHQRTIDLYRREIIELQYRLDSLSH